MTKSGTLSVCGSGLLAATLMTCLLSGKIGNSQSPALKWTAEFLVYYVVSFGLYATAVSHLLKREASRRSMWIVIGFAILFRLVATPGTPILENDIYRYVWEGRAVANGLNPYVYAPDNNSEQVKTLRQSDPAISEQHSKIGYPSVPAIYPPFAQYVFLLSHWLTPHPGAALIMYKVVLVLFDLAVIFLVIRILLCLHLPGTWCVVYAWSPLVIKEFANSGHVDSVGICMLLVAVYLFFKGRDHTAAIALSASVCTKFYPVILLPFVVRWLWPKGRRHVGTVFAVFVGTTAALYLPFMRAGTQLFTGLLTYASEWQINDSLFTALASAIGLVVGTGKGYTFAWGETGFAIHGEVHLLVAKIVAAGMLLTVMGWLLLRKKRERHHAFVHDGLVMIGAVFMLSPVQDPWYLCWIVPFLCVFPYHSWILLTGLQGLYYIILTLQNDPGFIFFPPLGINVETWLRGLTLLEYLPFYALLAWELYRSKGGPGREGSQT